MADIKSLQHLIELMAVLRSKSGCPWDRRQSPESLKPSVLEECYELLDAIDRGSKDEIRDELGDLLLQVIFQSQIFSEQGDFTIYDVADSICKKIIRRHPNVFTEKNLRAHDQKWEEIKAKERVENGQSNLLSDRIPRNFPALKYASKCSELIEREEAPKLFFQIKNQLLKINDLIKMLSGNHEKRASIFGEMLFCVARLAHTLGVDPEDALRNIVRSKIHEYDT